MDVWDSAGNAEYYHFDTRYHPVRLILLGMDALILMLCGVLCSRLAEAELDPEDAALAAAETEPLQPAAAPAYRRRERPVINFASARDGAEPAD